jgi:DNA-binding NtrC family response regulator
MTRQASSPRKIIPFHLSGRIPASESETATGRSQDQNQETNGLDPSNGARFQRTTDRPAQQSPRRILFFTSDDHLRSMVRAFLTEEGFSLFTCDDVRYAADVFHVSRIDLLIIDLHPLGRAGLRLAADAGHCFPGLPTIVFASPETDECMEELITKRGWKLLGKPILLPQLLGEIQRVFDPDQPDRLGKPVSRSEPRGSAIENEFGMRRGVR